MSLDHRETSLIHPDVQQDPSYEWTAVWSSTKWCRPPMCDPHNHSVGYLSVTAASLHDCRALIRWVSS